LKEKKEKIHKTKEEGHEKEHTCYQSRTSEREFVIKIEQLSQVNGNTHLEKERKQEQK
jgi:hypothetical protein